MNTMGWSERLKEINEYGPLVAEALVTIFNIGRDTLPTVSFKPKAYFDPNPTVISTFMEVFQRDGKPTEKLFQVNPLEIDKKVAALKLNDPTIEARMGPEGLVDLSAIVVLASVAGYSQGTLDGATIGEHLGEIVEIVISEQIKHHALDRHI